MMKIPRRKEASRKSLYSEEVRQIIEEYAKEFREVIEKLRKRLN
jgi:hypothetical protein